MITVQVYPVVVADLELHLELLDLETYNWVEGIPKAPRPATTFVKASETVVGFFEDGVLGRFPTPRELASWIPYAHAWQDGDAPVGTVLCGGTCEQHGSDCAVRLSQVEGHGGPRCCSPCNEAARDGNALLRGGGDRPRARGGTCSATSGLLARAGSFAGRGLELLQSAVGGNRLPEAPSPVARRAAEGSLDQKHRSPASCGSWRTSFAA